MCLIDLSKPVKCSTIKWSRAFNVSTKLYISLKINVEMQIWSKQSSITAWKGDIPSRKGSVIDPSAEACWIIGVKTEVCVWHKCNSLTNIFFLHYLLQALRLDLSRNLLSLCSDNPAWLKYATIVSAIWRTDYLNDFIILIIKTPQRFALDKSSHNLIMFGAEQYSSLRYCCRNI